MNTNEILEKLSRLNATVIAALIAAGTALLVALINLVIGILTYKNQKKGLSIQESGYELQLQNQKNQEITRQITQLEKERADFYIPFHLYLNESYLLYRNLRTNLPSGFRALIYLVDNDYLFEDSDGVPKKVDLDESQLELLKAIFALEDKLKDLIISKGGIIADVQLHMKYQPNNSITDVLLNFDPNLPENLPKDIGLLGLFMIHCSLIKFASSKKLNKKNIESYKNFVYPRELNSKIETNLNNITKAITDLKAQISN